MKQTTNVLSCGAGNTISSANALFAGIFLLLLNACATVSAPEGGPRDTTPPGLDSLNSSPNEQVNFTKQPIVLTFDEWVLLEDVNNQVLTSPPLEFRPKVRLKRRSVVFEFDEREQLRPDVTYTINFGNAVKDLTEKNPAENLRFVFATGARLDSLTLQGTLVDALSGEPVEKALFMLYDNLSDTVVRKERPLYYGKTDKQGQFEIKNIREGEFKGFALAEVNANYRYDLPNEKIGFPDTLVRMELGNRFNLQIPLFVEQPPLRVTEQDSSFNGWLKMAFNRPPERVSAAPADSTGRIYQVLEKDSLLVWIPAGAAATSFWVYQDSLVLDTLRVPAADTTRGGFPAFVMTVPSPLQRNLRQHPDQELLLRFRTPLRTIDSTGFRLLADSVQQVVSFGLHLDTLDARVLRLRHSWQEGIPYQLEIRPDAVTDIFGQRLDSALVFALSVDLRKSYGNIKLSLSALNPSFPYLLQLLLPDGQAYLSRHLAAGSEEATLSFSNLPAQAYTLRLVEDRNGNGSWDTGSFQEKRQPERILIQKLDPLRANWDLEAAVKFK